MDKNLIASSNINIQSTPEKVWDVLTNTVEIKKYLFGSEVITDWKIGSPIVFQGEYDGQKYKDKGNVIENKKNELLKYDYWNGFSGLEENRKTSRIQGFTNISARMFQRTRKINGFYFSKRK